jgi:hypothetical protein
MTQKTADMLYDDVRNTGRLLDEVWDAIDGYECETCNGTGEIAKRESTSEYRSIQDYDECAACSGTGEITTYEGQDAREYLEEMLLEIVWEKGEPFAVVLGIGGPHIEIRGGTRHDGSGYQIHGYWTGEHSTWSSEGVTKTGEYFRELMEEQNEIG